MPRKKKNGHIPAQVPGLSNESCSNTSYRTHGSNDDRAMGRGNLQLANSLYHDKDIVKNMQDIFSHLDPEVIHIVLAECDFKGNPV